VHLTRNVEFIESQDEVPRPLTPAQTAKKPTPQKPLDEVLVNPTTKTPVHPDLSLFSKILVHSARDDNEEKMVHSPILERKLP